MAIYIQDTEDWATSHQQELHWEALTRYGERVILKRKWQVEDFKSGLVSRCSRCADGSSGNLVSSRVTAVYKQSGDSHCKSCYGIGFESGFIEPSIVTYIIVNDDEQDIQRQRSGVREATEPMCQFAHYPIVRQGDLLVRYYNWQSETSPGVELARFLLASPSPTILRSGLAAGNTESNVLGFFL